MQVILADQMPMVVLGEVWTVVYRLVTAANVNHMRYANAGSVVRNGFAVQFSMTTVNQRPRCSQRVICCPQTFKHPISAPNDPMFMKKVGWVGKDFYNLEAGDAHPIPIKACRVRSD